MGAFVVVGIILTSFVAFIASLFILIFRLIWSAIVILLSLIRNIFSTRWIIPLLLATILFGVGLVFVTYQEETMTSADAVYECGVFQTAQVSDSLFFTLIRGTYEFFAEIWNDVLLFVYDAFATIIEDIANSIELYTLYKKSETLSPITEEIFQFTDDIVTIVRTIFRIIGQTLQRLANLLTCWVDLIIRLLTSITISRNFLNQGCTYCAMDPAINPPSNQESEFNCALRNPFPNRPDPDCMQCIDFLTEAWECTGIAFNLITFGVFEERLPRIMRAISCVIGSMFKPPAVIFSGLVDNLITDNCMGFSELLSTLTQWFTSTDCGKPDPDVNCELPGPECPTCSDLPIGVIPCFNEFLRAVTNDAVDDFFLLIFNFIFDFIAEIIESILGIVDCFADPIFLACMQNFPLQEHDIPDRGHCFYLDQSGIELVIPDGGLFECFSDLNECLDNPENITLLQPLYNIEVGGVSIMEFLLGDLWRFSIDLVTCPFALMVECFRDLDCEDTDGCDPAFEEPFLFLNPAFCISCCIETNVPPLAPIFRFLIELLEFIEFVGDFVLDVIDFVLTLIENFGDVFLCLFDCPGSGASILQIINCIRDPDGNNTCSDPDKILFDHSEESWNAFLEENNVYNDTLCGSILHNLDPSQLDINDAANYATYWFCVSVASGVVPFKQKCDADLVDLGAFYSLLTLRQATSALMECSRQSHRQSRTVETIKRGNIAVKEYAPKMKSLVGGFDLETGIIPQIGSKIKASPFYSLTLEFAARWKDIDKQYASNDTGIVLRSNFISDKEEQRRELYMLYVNAFMYNWKTMFAPGSFHKRSTEIAIPEVHSLQTFEDTKPINFTMLTFSDLRSNSEAGVSLYNDAKTWKEDTRNTYPILKRVLEIVTRRLNLDKVPLAQGIGATFYAAKTGNWQSYLAWTRNEKGFLFEEGFVEPDHYERKSAENTYHFNNSLFGYIGGRYDARRPRRFIPFPISSMPSYWHENASAVIMSLRDRKMLEREQLRQKGFRGTMRSHPQEIFDSNQIIYDVIDYVFAKLGLNASINDFVNDIIDFFSDFDFGGFTTDDLANFTDEYFSCAIPENIDGTDVFSPFCFGLLPEAMFRFFKLAPNDVFQVQIPWPEELIKEPCVNTYNGNNSLFFLELSNNCEIDDEFSSRRVLCDSIIPCDFCLKEYRACAAAICNFDNGTNIGAEELCDILGGMQLEDGTCNVNGNILSLQMQCELLGGELVPGFGDVVDTLFYLLLAIPRLLEFLISGSIDIKIVEDLLNLYVGIRLVRAFALTPIKLIVSILVAGTFSHFPTWTIAKLFGDQLPIGLLLAILMAWGIYLYPHYSFYLLIVYLAVTVLVVTWGFSLFFEFPNLVEVLDLVGWLLKALNAINDFPLFFWLNLTPLIMRLERFDIGTDPIPKVVNFCFGWTLGNFGLLFLVIFFGVFLIWFLFLFGFALVIFIQTFFLILFQFYVRLRNAVTRNKVDELEDQEHKKKIKALQRRINDQEAKLLKILNPYDVVIDLKEQFKTRRHKDSSGFVVRKRETSPEKKEK